MNQNSSNRNKKATAAFLLCTALVTAAPLPAFSLEEVNAVSATQQQQQAVSGMVKSTTGEPIIGANVREQGKPSNGTITDLDGNFKLKVTPGATLEVSYIGYKTITVKAGKDMIITLEEDTETLDEVVVVGYGTMRKKDLTGSIVQIKPEKLAVEAPKSVTDVLRGTPGMTVGISTSAKGGGGIRIRGVRSVSGTSLGDPLIIGRFY